MLEHEVAKAAGTDLAVGRYRGFFKYTFHFIISLGINEQVTLAVWAHFFIYLELGFKEKKQKKKRAIYTSILTFNMELPLAVLLFQHYESLIFHTEWQPASFNPLHS